MYLAQLDANNLAINDGTVSACRLAVKCPPTANFSKFEIREEILVLGRVGVSNK